MISKIIKAFSSKTINALLFHGVLKRGWVQYAVFHLFHVNRFLETPLLLRGSDILYGIFTQLAGFIEKWPGFGNLLAATSLMTIFGGRQPGKSFVGEVPMP